MRSLWLALTLCATSACVPVFRYADGEDASTTPDVSTMDDVVIDDRPVMGLPDSASIDATIDSGSDAISTADAMITRPDAQPDVPAVDAGPVVAAPPQTLCAGDAFTCAIVNDRVYCWGRNDATQTGSPNNGTGRCSDGVMAACPVRIVAGLESVIARQVTCGERFACALSDNGTVHCWGSNSHRQLGPLVAASMPSAGAATVGQWAAAQRITAGARHACVVVGAAVHCWGDNSAEQLGQLVGGAPSATPLPVVGLPVGSRVIEIRAGLQHTIARLDDNRIVGWGTDSFGQLSAAGADLRGATVLSLPPAGAGRASALAASWALSCIATDSGTVCGGSNLAGEIGAGSVDMTLRSNPMMASRIAATGALAIVAAGGKEFVAPMGVRQHACGALASDRRQLVCWGNNTRAQLGPGTGTDVSQPFPTIVTHTFAANVLGIAAGSAHTCARTNAAVFCWGSNSFDESANSGDGSPAGTTLTMPTLVRIP
ncbi:MAG: hypothetical protein U0269_21760 [Polyangiales bacterium]